MKGQPARKVLLIEGHPDLRLMLGLAIEEAGFEAHTEASTGAALKTLTDVPDIVAVILSAELDEGLKMATLLRDAWRETVLIVMIDRQMAAPLPAGAIYLSKLSLAKDVAGVLSRALKDTPGTAT